MRSPFFFSLLLLLALGACRAPLDAVTVQPQTYNITTDLDPVKSGAGAQVQGEGTEEQSMAELIAPYKAQLEEKMNRQIATLAKPLRKGNPESSLGNWMADLMMDAALRARLQASGLRALCYTVNDPADARRLVALDIDGIISDAVDRFSPGGSSVFD